MKRQRFWNRLAPEDRDALEGVARMRFLPRSDILMHRGDTVSVVYLPVSAYISNILYSGDGGTVMASNVGREGVTGLAAFLADQPIGWDVVVQVEGEAIAIPSENLRARFDDSPTLRASLLRLTHFQQLEAAQNALCNARHSVRARIARWLSELHDRTESLSFEITQEEVSALLKAQRTTVNAAFKTLIEAHSIASGRSQIKIVNLNVLQAQACDCYPTLATSRYWPLEN